MGKPAPDFTAETLGGDTITLGDLRGSPVALNFWATWCVPCTVEMPALESAAARYADQNLVVLAVNAGEPANVVGAFMDEYNLTFPALLDPDGGILDLYAIRKPDTYGFRFFTTRVKKDLLHHVALQVVPSISFERSLQLIWEHLRRADGVASTTFMHVGKHGSADDGRRLV